MQTDTAATQTFGELLRCLRDDRGLSRTRLARSAGVSRQYVEMLESGDRGHPSSHALAAFAAALDLQAGERAAFFGVASAPAPAPAPLQRYAAAAIATHLVRSAPYPAFAVDRLWSLQAWSPLVPAVFEVYIAGLPAGAHNLLEVLLGPEMRAHLLNYDEAGAAVVALFKLQTLRLSHTADYRQVLRSLRAMPGFPALFRASRPAAVVASTSLLGLEHSRLGPLWLACVVSVLAGRDEPLIVGFTPADPATEAAIDQIRAKATPHSAPDC